MVYSRVPQVDASHEIRSTDEERANPSDRLVNTFESDSEDENWVDDREANALEAEANGQPGSSESVQSPSKAPWTNIFSRLRKKKTESGHGNGVFGNLVAKGEEPETDDGEHASNEKPPSYEEAAADATPSYWETTIMSSDWSDEVLVGDMPVGSPMHFAWNMLVSAMFSVIGFVVCYLFHTTHAARSGSLAGLGCTLIQSSYSFDTSATAPSTPPDEFTPDDPNNFDGSMMSGTITHPQNMNDDCGDRGPGGDGTTASAHAPLISNLLFIVGCILIVHGLAEYLRAQFIKTRILRYNSEQQHPEESEQAEPTNPEQAEEIHA